MLIGFEIEKCDKCPFVKTELTFGGGYAMDYICTKTNKKIVGYVEWDHEIPEVPEWCPCKIEITEPQSSYKI